MHFLLFLGHAADLRTLVGVLPHQIFAENQRGDVANHRVFLLQKAAAKQRQFLERDTVLADESQVGVYRKLSAQSIFAGTLKREMTNLAVLEKARQREVHDTPGFGGHPLGRFAGSGRHVRDEIQRRILSGESLPGERLPQQSLARKLGVGQGTVRESLLELEWLGLVDSIDGLGIFVGTLGASRLIEAYEVREYLEGLAARRACGRVSKSDITALRNIASEILALSSQGKVEEMPRLPPFQFKFGFAHGNTALRADDEAFVQGKLDLPIGVAQVVNASPYFTGEDRLQRMPKAGVGK